MTKYAAGRRAEWKVKRLLLEAGAYCVTRAAGSKGPCDLVAFFDTHTFAVQVKRARPTAAEHLELVEASKRTAAKWVMVHSDRDIVTWVYHLGKETKLKVPGL